MSEKSRALSVFGNDHFWPRFFDPLREFGSVISNFFSPNADAVNKEDCYEIRLELPRAISVLIEPLGSIKTVKMALKY